MRKITTTLALVATILFSGTSTASAQTVPVDGQVMKIDEPAGKITLKHGPIRNLDMDGMTMVFRVKDPQMLRTVKVGDRVTFEADRVNGAITVTKIDRKK
jgi:Cu/Ag efflux protein CusF